MFHQIISIPSGNQVQKPILSCEGCVTDFNTISKALQGVDTVYHIAGKISFGTFPDIKGMYQINVEGNCSNLLINMIKTLLCWLQAV